jgi:hypothetical protein
MLAEMGVNTVTLLRMYWKDLQGGRAPPVAMRYDAGLSRSVI